MTEILRKKAPGGYSIDVVTDVIKDAVREFSHRKFTGRISPDIHFTEGTISKFEMGQKATVKRKQ